MRVILFDVDGTLIRGAGTGRKALEHAFAATFGVEDVARATRVVRFSGVLDPAIHADMASCLGIPAALLAARREALVDTYLARLRREVQRDATGHVLPGVQDLLDRLRGRSDILLGLVTGNLEAGARIKLEAHGLNPYFASGGFGQDAPTRAEVTRVAVERVLRAAEAAREAEQVTVIGDSELDVEAGRSNGFRTVAVATGWTSAADLAAAGPDHLLENLDADGGILEILGAAERQPQ